MAQATNTVKQCDLSTHPIFGRAHSHGPAVVRVTTEGRDGTVTQNLCAACYSYLTETVDEDATVHVETIA